MSWRFPFLTRKRRYLSAIEAASNLPLDLPADAAAQREIRIAVENFIAVLWSKP